MPEEESIPSLERSDVDARTTTLAGGGLVGDIQTAVAAVVRAGGEVAVPPMETSGHGTFAIYLQGGNDHGLWQL
jgi:predicted enzyme related to lactoylglutathione lyase